MGDVGVADPRGDRLIELNLWGTAVFAVAAIAAAIFPAVLAVPVAVLDGAFFVAGCVAFMWAYAIAVGRSRTDEISVAGLYLMLGSTPPRVRRTMLGATVAQSVIALATAAARPFTALAFGVLVPMFGLGLSGLWAARYGEFRPRDDRDPRIKD